MSDSWVRDRMQAGDFPRPGETAEQYVEAFLNFRLSKLIIDSEDGFSLDAERARLAHEQANAKAMDNAERRKELASRTDMVAAGAGVIIMAVSRLQQIGAQVAQGDAKLRKRIETAINDVLTDLSMTRIEEAVGGGFDDEDAPGDDDD